MLSATVLLVFALPVFAAVHESLASVPSGWVESATSVADSAPIQLQVALQYQNLDLLEIELANVSTPGSPNYGKYYDIVGLESMFGPSNESISKVIDWLDGAGATSISSYGGMISFLTTVGQANSMLDTEFKVYTDGTTQRLLTTAYSIPDGLGEHIDFMSPTTYFANTKAQSVVPRVRGSKASHDTLRRRQLQSSCEMTITYSFAPNSTKNYTVMGPECLKQLYNIGGYKPDPNSGSTIAFSSFLNQSASYSDLAQFEQIWSLPSQNFSVLALINGGVDDQDPDTENLIEADSDVQTMIGLVGGLPVGEYIVGGLAPFIPDLISPNVSTETNEPYLEYYQYLLSQPNSELPYVITNSYIDHENTVPELYARRVCNMIGMMGLRGRTILESSGDEGVGSVCMNNVAPYQPQFIPQFPATCPYVTAVGGTEYAYPEFGWLYSSGGFSFYFKQPWYQKMAVDTYLNQYINPGAKQEYSSNNYTDFTGRGFPDIAAHSVYPDYYTVQYGQPTPSGGTSAAAPVVASILALINDARFRAGKPAVGFVNPVLYAIGVGGLNDINNGTVSGCDGTDPSTGDPLPGAVVISDVTWNATVGWDPVTGLGTPNFAKLKDIFMSF